MLSFTELDADFEDENLNLGTGDDPVAESPTETARPTKRKGLSQQKRQKAYGVEDADIVEEDELEEQYEQEEQEELQDYGDVRGNYGDDYGGDYGGDSFGQEESFEEQQDPPNEDVEDVEEEEEDIYGHQPSPPPVQRARGRSKASDKPIPLNKPKKAVGRPKASSTQPAPKRARTTSTAPRASSQPPKIIERKEVPHPADISMMDGDGNYHMTKLSKVRRSTRIRVAPLAHWKNERIVYELEGRRASGPALPKIKEIVRIDTPPQPHRTHTTHRKRKARADSVSDDDSDAGEVWGPIKDLDGTTIDEYKIAVAKSAMDTQPLQGNKVRYQKVFQDGSYTAAGIIELSVGGIKGAKSTKHSFMSFVVLSGRAEVKVHRTAFIIGKGGVFVVPRGTTSDDTI
jgi:centromere protein C